MAKPTKGAKPAKSIRVSISIDSEVSDSSNDIYTFTCPFKKLVVSYTGLDVQELMCFDKISHAQYEYFSDVYAISNAFCDPMEISLKLDEEEYNQIFAKLNYSQEQEIEDKSKLHTLLQLKVNEIMATPELYAKYTSDIDPSDCSFCKWKITCERFSSDTEKRKNCYEFEFEGGK